MLIEHRRDVVLAGQDASQVPDRVRGRRSSTEGVAVNATQRATPSRPSGRLSHGQGGPRREPSLPRVTVAAAQAREPARSPGQRLQSPPRTPRDTPPWRGGWHDLARVRGGAPLEHADAVASKAPAYRDEPGRARLAPRRVDRVRKPADAVVAVVAASVKSRFSCAHHYREARLFSNVLFCDGPGHGDSVADAKGGLVFAS